LSGPLQHHLPEPGRHRRAAALPARGGGAEQHPEHAGDRCPGPGGRAGERPDHLHPHPGRSRGRRELRRGGHGEPMTRTVLDGPMLLALPIAVLAGLVSFLSPCVLPLVPGYLGYVTGLTGIDLDQQRRGRMAAAVGLFVLGFSAVFVTVGWIAGTAGDLLVGRRDLLTRILGVLTIVLGLAFLGVLPG